MVGVQGSRGLHLGPGIGSLGRGDLFVFVHQDPDLLLQSGEIRDGLVHGLEEGDDVPFDRVAFLRAARSVQPATDLLVLGTKGWQGTVSHFPAPMICRFALASSFWGFTPSAVFHSAAARSRSSRL